MSDFVSQLVALRSVLDQPWTSVLDFGITKNMKAADGKLWAELG